MKQLRLSNQICHRLYVASNGITRLYRPLLAELGITYPQYVVMMALWEEDKLSMGAVSELTSMDKGFLTSLISKMESENLIEIRPDESDKRKRILYLTRKGRSLEKRAEKIPEQLACKLSGGEDLDINIGELQMMLDKLNKAIVT